MRKVRGLRSTPRIIGLLLIALTVAATLVFFAGQSEASHGSACNELPSHDRLQSALIAAQGEANGGFAFHMWGTVVNRTGVVCAVAFTGADLGDQWPASRVISAQKATTANSLTHPGFALSTANLFSAVQPGGSLFGLQHSNPVNTIVAYGGDPDLMGTHDDPMVGKRIGGVAGVGSPGDNIVYDTTVDTATGHTTTAGGWGHPACTAESTAVAEGFATSHPLGP